MHFVRSILALGLFLVNILLGQNDKDGVIIITITQTPSNFVRGVLRQSSRNNKDREDNLLESHSKSIGNHKKPWKDLSKTAGKP